MQGSSWNGAAPRAALNLLPPAASIPPHCARAGGRFGAPLWICWHVGLDFSLYCKWSSSQAAARLQLGQGRQWEMPDPPHPTQLLRQACKKRKIVQTLLNHPKRAPAAYCRAVGSALRQPSSICVFPCAGACCQAARDESRGARRTYPHTTGFLPDRRLPPAAPPRTRSPRKEKNAQSSMKSVLWPPSHPSPSLLSRQCRQEAAAGHSCQPIAEASFPLAV